MQKNKKKLFRHIISKLELCWIGKFVHLFSVNLYSNLNAKLLPFILIPTISYEKNKYPPVSKLSIIVNNWSFYLKGARRVNYDKYLKYHKGLYLNQNSTNEFMPF